MHPYFPQGQFDEGVAREDRIEGKRMNRDSPCDSHEGAENREMGNTSGGNEERNEACHDISLACADSSSFVTVAAINNSAILSLWIIRIGLRSWAVVVVGPG